MPGKVTASTFALERPCCIFDPHANASDAVWLVVAFADASAAFKNPTSGAEVPPYEALPTARAYMTLEMAAAAYGCSAPGAAVLRVGGDTACHGPAPCNGPLPSPGPYRVKFLLMSCHGPRAETKWSDPILLRRARSLTTIDPTPAHRSSSAVIIAALLASLGAALAMAMLGAVGYEWETLTYTPVLAGAELGGRVTGSTFVLEQPRCIFKIYDTDDIWLVVATTAAQDPASGPGMDGGHSGAMITITAILSVLLAVLLAALLATLCGSEVCGAGSFRPDATSIQRYNTHHVYDQPAARL
ncbi:hypothetical protein ASZ78_016266 [Callipepla squamata]|uniref:Uroplakin 3B n=1 Tax=Callipepla squamata TaxID=9009 RepID=A0A226NBV9_CALSU|nr:hypothetical protein ASZ78_016266 [Callipepla squamata]